MVLSVALCAYNGEHFIVQQVRSILEQTMPVDEIVVCDDRSSDNTIALLQQLQKESIIPIQIHINDTNIGVCKNFQKAISLCKGDIIFLSDQDDVWMPNKVESVVTWFSENPQKKVVFTNASLIDEEGRCFSEKSLFDCVGLDADALKAIDDGYGLELFCAENRVTGATMAIQKNLVWNAEDCNKDILHDEVIALMALQEDALGYLDKLLIQYRIHRNQTQGLLLWINHPITGDYLCPSSYGMRYSAFQLNQTVRKRILFSNWRSGLKHSIWGPFKSIIRLNTYKELYGNASVRFFKYDIHISIHHTFHRIAQKVS